MQKIKIGDVEVGIYGLDEIFKEVSKLGMGGETLKKELLRRIKADNYVPKNKEDEYMQVILEAYKSFCKKQHQD